MRNWEELKTAARQAIVTGKAEMEAERGEIFIVLRETGQANNADARHNVVLNGVRLVEVKQ